MTTSIPKTLVISSTVASSRVGASAASFCLQRLGIETVVLPTTLMGRHPGWGPPGGGAVDAARLRDIWEGVKAQDLQFDGVLTGYMGDTDHVDLCAEIIEHIRQQNPNVTIAVDPVMGDHGRLYIPEARAAAIIDRLVPLADFITPNLWELDYIKSHSTRHSGDLPARLITSYPDVDDIGARWESRDNGEVTVFQVSHPKFTSVPHGGGDSLAALFLGRRLLGQTSRQALAASVSSVYEIMRAADALDAGELPLIRMQAFITDALPLHVTS